MSALLCCFGSVVRGIGGPQSDVDLLGDSKDASFERVVDLSTKFTRTVGRTVDVLDVRHAEAEPGFLAQLLVDGRILIDREDL